MDPDPNPTEDAADAAPDARRKLVCFRSFGRQEPANILAAVLNDNGVEASVFTDDAGGAMPFIGNVEGYRVMVGADAFERALEVERDAARLPAESPAGTDSADSSFLPSQPQPPGTILLGQGIRERCWAARRVTTGLSIVSRDSNQEHFIPESAFHLQVQLLEDDPQGPILRVNLPEEHDLTVSPADVPAVRAWLGPMTVHHLRSAIQDSGSLILPLAVLAAILAAVMPTGVHSLLWSTVAIFSFTAFLAIARATAASTFLLAVCPELWFVSALALQSFIEEWPVRTISGHKWSFWFVFLFFLFLFRLRHGWKLYRRFRRSDFAALVRRRT